MLPVEEKLSLAHLLTEQIYIVMPQLFLVTHLEKLKHIEASEKVVYII